MNFITKDYTSDSAVADISGNKVKTVWSATSIKDFDGDVIVDGAFKKTISEWGPTASRWIYSVNDHIFKTTNIIGDLKELYTENQQLIAITEFINTPHSKDYKTLYENKIIKQHSIGFAIPKGKQEQKEGYNEIREVMLYEGSAVMRGANQFTQTIGMKSLTKDEAIGIFNNLFQEFNDMLNLSKNGSLTDKTFGLLELNLLQKKTEISDFVAKHFSENTQPSDDTKPLEDPQTPAPEQAKKINWNTVLLNLK